MSPTLAASVATTLFNEVSAIKKEIKFSATFVPQMEILDKAEITYSSGEFQFGSLWDVNNWGDDTATIASGDLVWSSADGDSIDLSAFATKLLNVEIDLDKLETRVSAREV